MSLRLKSTNKEVHPLTFFSENGVDYVRAMIPLPAPHTRIHRVGRVRGISIPKRGTVQIIRRDKLYTPARPKITL